MLLLIELQIKRSPVGQLSPWQVVAWARWIAKVRKATSQAISSANKSGMNNDDGFGVCEGGEKEDSFIPRYSIYS